MIKYIIALCLGTADLIVWGLTKTGLVSTYPVSYAKRGSSGISSQRVQAASTSCSSMPEPSTLQKHQKQLSGKLLLSHGFTFEEPRFVILHGAHLCNTCPRPWCLVIRLALLHKSCGFYYVMDPLEAMPKPESYVSN